MLDSEMLKYTNRKIKMNWAASWENLFLAYANNKGADHPSRSLISTFIVRCLDSIKPLVSISKISSRQLISVAEQAGLSLTWAQTSRTRFSWRISFSFGMLIMRNYSKQHELTSF